MLQDVQAVVDEVAALLGGAVTLEDREFQLVAFNAHPGEVLDDVRRASILQRGSSAQVREWFEGFGIATSDVPVRVPRRSSSDDRAPDVAARLCLPARWRGVTHGYLWVIDEPTVPGDRVEAAQALAANAGWLLARLWRTRADLAAHLDALLSTDADMAEQAAAEVHEVGLIPRHTPVVALACAQASGRTDARPGPDGAGSPVSYWRLPRSVLASATDDGTLALAVPLGTAADLAPAHRVARQLRGLLHEAGADAPVAIGDPVQDLAQLRTSWRQARRALAVAATEPDLGPVVTWADLGVHRLLACGPRPALVEAVLDRRVTALLAAGSDDLVRTARTYLDLAGDAQRTASALAIHRQTLYQRLHRVEQLTGLSLKQGTDRLVLHLGLTLATGLGAATGVPVRGPATPAPAPAAGPA